MKPDIDCLKNLHTGQLQQLRVFIETLGHRKAAERASEEFNQPIHKTALQRFMRRSAPAEFLEDTPDNDEATRQVLKFAADGQADFTASTVHALEQLAFQLAFTCTAVDDDMNALMKITAMLCRFRNAATRERMAVVQEGKLKLRQHQFEKSNNADHDTKIQELNEKISAAFSQHPVLTAIRNAEQSGADSSDPNPNPNPNPSTDPNPNPNPNPNLSTDPNSQSAIRDPQSTPVPPKNKNPKHARSLPRVRSVPSSAKSAPSAVPFIEHPTNNEPHTANDHE